MSEYMNGTQKILFKCWKYIYIYYKSVSLILWGSTITKTLQNSLEASISVRCTQVLSNDEVCPGQAGPRLAVRESVLKLCFKNKSYQWPLPIIPEREQVFFNEFKDAFNPKPERKIFIIYIFLQVYKCTH